MSLGEYEYSDSIANNFKNDPTGISKGFAALLFLGLILFGSITMINLLVAVVISDVSALKKDVFRKVKLTDNDNCCQRLALNQLLDIYFKLSKITMGQNIYLELFVFKTKFPVLKQIIALASATRHVQIFIYFSCRP